MSYEIQKPDFTSSPPPPPPPLLPHPHPHPQPVQYQWLFLLDSRLVHLFKLTEKKMQTADKVLSAFIWSNYILFSCVVVSDFPETKVTPTTTGLLTS